MSAPPVLCPVDFSPASRGALRYASAVAAHLGVGMVVLTVEDPMLTEAMDVATGVPWKPEDTTRELEEFTVHTLAPDDKAVPIAYEVAVGKSASEILRVAQDLSCQLIVISTHGLTGMRKLFFGSTTERVLRETTVPVLITPGTDPGRLKVGDARSVLHRILVPVDLSPASPEQLRIAQGVSEMLSVPLIVAHVVEPIRSRLAARLHLPSIETDRRAVAEEGLKDLVAALPGQPEALIAYGDPAEEIAKVARDRQAGLVVMGLHASPLLGPRMGSVTYRMLCLTPAMVLALPPARVGAGDAAGSGASGPGRS